MAASATLCSKQLKEAGIKKNAKETSFSDFCFFIINFTIQ